MSWHEIAAQQDGVVARRQLLGLGLDADRVRNQVAAGRWQVLSPTVIATFTGSLSPRQWMWAGVLHPAAPAYVTGTTAARLDGLRGWGRPRALVMVGDRAHLPGPLPEVEYVRTRRDLSELRSERPGIPRLRLEPAVLLHAAADPNPRAAQGLLVAVVQQRLTTAARLGSALDSLHPTRRSALFRQLLAEVDLGAEALSEAEFVRACVRHGLARPSQQVVRVDRDGVARRRDAEWLLADGSRVVLEIDGVPHLEVRQWESDLRRGRLTARADEIRVRCSAREVRDEAAGLMRDLRALGVPTSQSLPSRRVPARREGND